MAAAAMGMVASGMMMPWEWRGLCGLSLGRLQDLPRQVGGMWVHLRIIIVITMVLIIPAGRKSKMNKEKRKRTMTLMDICTAT